MQFVEIHELTDLKNVTTGTLHLETGVLTNVNLKLIQFVLEMVPAHVLFVETE